MFHLARFKNALGTADLFHLAYCKNALDTADKFHLACCKNNLDTADLSTISERPGLSRIQVTVPGYWIGALEPRILDQIESGSCN